METTGDGWNQETEMMASSNHSSDPRREKDDTFSFSECGCRCFPPRRCFRAIIFRHQTCTLLFMACQRSCTHLLHQSCDPTHAARLKCTHRSAVSPALSSQSMELLRPPN
ncbi:unnamed protein product [Musa banksii]